MKPAAGGQAPVSLNPGAWCAVVVAPINLTLPLSLRAGRLPKTASGANGQLRIKGLFREDKGLGERNKEKKKVLCSLWRNLRRFLCSVC